MKKGDRAAALATFHQVLAHYPEIRDPNKMSLRFLAQYQIAVCLESLGRDQEAIEAILHLHQDLLERSDTVNTLQYVFFGANPALGSAASDVSKVIRSKALSDAIPYAVTAK